MGRSAEGWKLRRDPRSGIYSVRFRHAGKRHDISTGQRTLARARPEAARIYAEEIARGRARVTTRASLRDLFAEWIVDMESECTPETTRNRRYKALAVLEPAFGTLARITTPAMQEHFRSRLKVALRGSIRHDASCLRGFLRWCVEKEHIEAAPDVPIISRSAAGTRTGWRKESAVPLSADETRRILAELPERSPKGLIVRARFVVQWETSLRQATIGKLTAPEHFRRGARTLTITDGIDKARFGRELPLTDAARAALDASCPDSGLIFGRGSISHFTASLQAAAQAAGIDPEKVALLSSYDLRHGRITNLLDAGAPLRAVAFLAGHKKITTTNAYVAVREAHDQAADALALLGGVSGGAAVRDAGNGREPEKT